MVILYFLALVSDQFLVTADTLSSGFGIGIGKLNMASEHPEGSHCRQLEEFNSWQRFVVLLNCRSLIFTQLPARKSSVSLLEKRCNTCAFYVR